MRITTETGSVYHIDLKNGIWERKTATGDSGHLRGESGMFHFVGRVKVGRRLELICPPLVPGQHGRIISTSPVTRIER